MDLHHHIAVLQTAALLFRHATKGEGWGIAPHPTWGNSVSYCLFARTASFSSAIIQSTTRSENPLTRIHPAPVTGNAGA